MKITDALYGEHGLFYCQLDYLEAVLAAPELPELNVLRALAGGLERMLATRAAIEDDGLFIALEGRIGGAGPLQVMRAEHQEIEALSAAATAAESRDDCAGFLGNLTALLRQHFMKEERVLFVLAQQCLDETALNDLGDKWAETRAVAVRGPDDAPGCH